MFANRIRRFFIEEPARSQQQSLAAFAMLPARAAAGAGAAAPDIYRMAYEQAQRQVAQRQERQRRAHEWN